MSNDSREGKKTWQKPELIILTRSTPEEAVLTACKLGNSTLGPATGLSCAQTTCSVNKNS